MLKQNRQIMMTQKERIDDGRQTLNDIIIKLSKEKTQKERIDKGRQAFNDEIIRCSESDNLYEAILEWEFNWKIDYYLHDIDIDIMKEILINEGRSDIADKVKLNEYAGDYGSCICGKHNLRRVYYIQNKINKNVLPTGSDCIKKVFPDGSITKENILFIDKILDRSKRSVNKIREENKNLKVENKALLERNIDLILENKKLKSKIDELILENKTKTDNTDKIKLTKKIESLEDEIKRLKDVNILSIYKKMYGSEMNKEFDKLLF